MEALAISDELRQDDETQKLSVPAKRLMEKLTPIPSKAEEMSRRWFWGLLQNASDYNESVDVVLDITDQEVIFSHNGVPFSTMDVLNLIAPNSEKDTIDDKKSIGKFGSGLISTHFLSSTIRVKGIIRSKQEGRFHSFDLPLNRENYTDKAWLINSQQTSRKRLDASLAEAKYVPKKFDTQFIYDLEKPFAQIFIKEHLPQSLSYLIDMLPYTLSFMEKVKSVTINNQSGFLQRFKSYSIKFEKEENQLITFNTITDGEVKKLHFLKISKQNVSTTIQLEGNSIVPFPKYTGKLFCGLPMVGTEACGLPIIINSFLFVPTTEREGIQLSPTDKENKNLLLEGINLYEDVVNKLVRIGCTNIFEICSINYNYSGSESSVIFFKNEIIKKIANTLKKLPVIITANGEKKPLEKCKLPFESSDSGLMKGNILSEFQRVAVDFHPNDLPGLATINNWSKVINFIIFPESKYDFKTFLQDVTKTKQLSGFKLKDNANVESWLKSIITLTGEVDENLFNKFALFPNYDGDLKTKEEPIYFGENLPPDLIQIFDAISNEKYGAQLLHPAFSTFKKFLGIHRTKGLQDLTNSIDDLMKDKYKENNGSTLTFVPVLRDLMTWYQGFKGTKEELKKYFPWFSEKRAVLFLDTFSERERNAALNIAQSGKMEALSELANSAITSEQIKVLSQKAYQIDQILALLQDHVDDATMANEETGNKGEEIVFRDLQKRFPKFQGFEVIWASKLNNEAKYDFEILKSGSVVKYIDAKTTIRGMMNSDSVPFFMRKSQWDFLDSSDTTGKYYLARLFLGGKEPIIQYLEINKISFN